MDHTDFHSWCCDAVRKIIYLPDREAVYNELKAHMEDRYDAYRELGLSEEEAARRTLHAMGDAKEIAPQLAEIHKPFWGFAYEVCKKVALILAVVLLISLLSGFLNALPFPDNDPYASMEWKPYGEVRQESEHDVRTRLAYIEPDVSYTDSSYTITLSKATHWLVESKNPNLANSREFCFRFDITTPWLWADKPTFTDWIWAEDSLGNHYYGDKESLRFYNDEEYYHHYLRSTADTIKNNPFSYSCYLEIQVWKGSRVEDIEWIDLHYDRGGRDMVFRVDLTGGEG